MIGALKIYLRATNGDVAEIRCRWFVSGARVEGGQRVVSSALGIQQDTVLCDKLRLTRSRRDWVYRRVYQIERRDVT